MRGRCTGKGPLDKHRASSPLPQPPAKESRACERAGHAGGVPRGQRGTPSALFLVLLTPGLPHTCPEPRPPKNVPGCPAPLGPPGVTSCPLPALPAPRDQLRLEHTALCTSSPGIAPERGRAGPGSLHLAVSRMSSSPGPSREPQDLGHKPLPLLWSGGLSARPSRAE